MAGQCTKLKWGCTLLYAGVIAELLQKAGSAPLLYFLVRGAIPLFSKQLQENKAIDFSKCQPI
jgi:hypothetical protein